MSWLKKFKNWFKKYSTKELRLRELKSGKTIYIDIPNGYSATINGKKYNNQPLTVDVENNDPIDRKIWFYCRVDGTDISFVRSYDSHVFENFLLYNYINTVVEPDDTKTKEELKKELEDAISNDNYEMAKLINNKLKELN